MVYGICGTRNKAKVPFLVQDKIPEYFPVFSELSAPNRSATALVSHVLGGFIWKLLFISANPNDKGISRFGLFWAAPLGSLADVCDIINFRNLDAFLCDRKTERVAAFVVLPEALARALVLDLRLPAIV